MNPDPDTIPANGKLGSVYTRSREEVRVRGQVRARVRVMVRVRVRGGVYLGGRKRTVHLPG